MSAAVLSLRCPRCGAALAGAQEDVLFWCGECGLAHEVAGDRFVERPGRLAAGRPAGGDNLLYLPLWAFGVSAICHSKDAERRALARSIPPVERAYVTGFRLHNPAYFGDPGLIFTERRVILEQPPEAPGGIVVAGCCRGLDEATAYVAPHVLTIIDRRVDVTDMKLDSTIGDPVLWGVPYVDGGDVLTDGILGLRLPATAVEAIEEIRACQCKRRA